MAEAMCGPCRLHQHTRCEAGLACGCPECRHADPTPPDPNVIYEREDGTRFRIVAVTGGGEDQSFLIGEPPPKYVMVGWFAKHKRRWLFTEDPEQVEQWRKQGILEIVGAFKEA